jgi:hypothetical protein
MPMRTTLNLADDALLVAQDLARRQNISLGEAVTRLIRTAAAAPAQACTAEPRGRYALAPRRDEVVTVEHVRDLMAAEGI